MANILLIEPDRLLADSYRQALESVGHEVMMCASAQSAIFGADAMSPDLAILELQLSEHSGIEFLYEFRSYADWQAVPVIILSHVPPAEFAASGRLLTRELGVKRYHYKPHTTLTELLADVAQLLPQAAPQP